MSIGACSTAEPLIVRDQEDFDYPVGQGPVVVSTVFESSIPGCLMRLTFDTEEEVGDMPYNGAIFRINLATGAVTLDTQNVAYVGYRFKVDLEARMRDSRAEASYLFYITIVHGCKTLPVDPPTAIDNPPFTFDLWTEAAFSFNYAQLVPANANQSPWYNCGDLMYSLVDA